MTCTETERRVIGNSVYFADKPALVLTVVVRIRTRSLSYARVTSSGGDLSAESRSCYRVNIAQKGQQHAGSINKQADFRA